MNQLSRNKVLITIIAILLITNLVMLYFFFRVQHHGQPETSKRLGFTERLKKDVGFTPEQMAVFEPRKKDFWKEMRSKFDTIKDTKVAFYSLLYDASVPDSLLESRASVIGEQQKDLDLFVIRHFKDVRKMCTPEQLPKYDSLMPAIIERMTTSPARK